MTTVTLCPEDDARLRAGWAEWLNSRKGRLRPRTFEQWVGDFIHDYAATFPEVPAPAARRSLSQVREEARQRNGGVSPYTEQLQIIRVARAEEPS